MVFILLIYWFQTTKLHLTNAMHCYSVRYTLIIKSMYRLTKFFLTEINYIIYCNGNPVENWSTAQKFYRGIPQDITKKLICYSLIGQVLVHTQYHNHPLSRKLREICNVELKKVDAYNIRDRNVKLNERVVGYPQCLPGNLLLEFPIFEIK